MPAQYRDRTQPEVPRVHGAQRGESQGDGILLADGTIGPDQLLQQISHG